MDLLDGVVSLCCSCLDSLDEDPDVLDAFVELGRGGLVQDLVTKRAEASHEDSVGAGRHRVSVVRVKATEAIDVN